MGAIVTKILAALGISKMLTALVLLGAIALAGLGGKLWIDRLNAENALLTKEKNDAEQKAADNAAVVKQLHDDQQKSVAVMADLAGALGKLDGVTNTVIKEIVNAPPSTACLDSPGMRGFLGGLRHDPAGAAPAAGGTPAAGRPGGGMSAPR